MAKGGVRIQILGEFNPKGFDDAQKAAEGLSAEMKTLAKTVGAAFATREVVNFAKGAVDAASDLGESVNAVAVTFGDASDDILALGENAATTVGLSAREFNAFAVQFSGFTQQIAGAGGDIAEVTDDLTTRVADFASVMNMDIPEAAQVFQSALAGETEPIRKFGIDMSAAAVEAHALATGMIASKSEMTEAIKVQARYSLLMESTNKVAGDFANTSDSLANQQRILTARLDDAQATIGGALVPVLESLLNIVTPVLDAFTALPDDLQQVIATAGLLAVGMKSASTALQGFGISASTANKMARGLGVTIGAGLLVLNQYTTAKNQVAAASDRVKEALDAETGAVTENTDNLIRQQLMTGELGKAMEMLGLDVDLATEAIMGNDDAAYEFIDTINKADQELVGLGDGFKSLFTSEMQNIDAVRIVRREYKGMRVGFRDARDEAGRLNEELDDTNVIIGRVDASATELVPSVDDVKAAIQQGSKALEEHITLNEEFESALDDVIEQVFGLNNEFKELLGLLDREEAFRNVNDAILELVTAQDEFGASSREAIEAQAELTREVAAAIETYGNVPDVVQTQMRVALDEQDFERVRGMLFQLGELARVPEMEAREFFETFGDELGLGGGGFNPAGTPVAPVSSTKFVDGVAVPVPLSSTVIGANDLNTGSAKSAMKAGNVTVNVTMPAGSNGEDVVRAVRKYARNTGTLPIPVTDKVRT